MQVALIKFKEAGKKYYFSYNGLDIDVNDNVIVETARGLEIGMVYLLKDIDASDLTSELKPVLRKATSEDLEDEAYNEASETGVIEQTKKLVKKNELDMKILGAEYTLDRKRLLIYFAADGRVDFRQLVRDLSEVYHTRIELRQVGPRDAAKMIGGIGPCGLILCCTSFIGEFETVSIRMAKNQNLALNPQKISGVCGKLLCCIRYEDEAYTALKKTLPDVKEYVNTEKGKAYVLDINILGQKIKVKYNDEDTIEWLEKDSFERFS